MRFFAIAFPVLALLAAGCSSSNTDTNTTPDGGTVTNPDAGGATTPTAATLPFKPSNINLDGIDASKLGDFVVSSASCSFHSEAKEVSCGDSGALAYITVDQPGAGKIGVYVAKSIRVEPNAGIVAKGTYALAIVALDSFDVQGTVDVGARSSFPSAGGFVHPNKDLSKGGGQGGGGAGTTTNAGGGGSYCGIGGKGGFIVGGVASLGGTAYGTPENIPLVGGSAGGTAALNDSGTGGGAIQLVAGKTFTLGANAIVNAGGGGGAFVGAPDSQHGAGGGSGGAILIEAPTIVMLGSLLAEGGAGGSKETGADAQLDAAQAMSEAQTNGTVGGHGSGNADLNGGDGMWLTGDRAPGGGGGSGRIRVNSSNGNVALSAKVLSPSENTPCTTEGVLIGL